MIKITSTLLFVILHNGSSSGVANGHELHGQEHHDRVLVPQLRRRDKNAAVTVDCLNCDLTSFEGDIIPTYDTVRSHYGKKTTKKLVKLGLVEKPTDSSTKKDAVSDDRYRWSYRDNTDDKVAIPYVFSFGHSEAQKDIIRDAASTLAEKIGYIKFVPRTNEPNYINYVYNNGVGCSSYVGMIGGGQRMTIGWCASSIYKGSIIHEHLHAVGFWHEQSRPDRDDYVRIETNNIRPEAVFNFEKVTDSRTNGVPYDFESLMHYPKTAFAKSSGLQTIFTKPNGANDNIIGQRGAASEEDLEGVKLLYQCVSGARTRSQMQADPCTADCKCTENEFGCRVDGVDNSSTCMRNLSCSNNRCVKNTSTPPPTPRPNSKPTLPPTPTSYVSFENKQHKGKCMDLAYSDTSNGGDVVLYSCHGGPNQKWLMDENGYIRSAIDNNKCLDPRGPSIANGAAIQIWDCVPNYTYQQWIHSSSDNTIRPKMNTVQCIDVVNANEYNLQIYECNGLDDKVWIAINGSTPSPTTRPPKSRLPTQGPNSGSTSSPTTRPPKSRSPTQGPPSNGPISTPRPTPLTNSCGSITDSSECKTKDCCRWARKTKTCVNAPCGNGCKGSSTKTDCLGNSQACCNWKNDRECKAIRRCGNCKFRKNNRICNNDGCCQWSDSAKKCSNKNVCSLGRYGIPLKSDE